MLTVKVTIDPDVLNAVRSLPDRVAPAMGQYVANVVQPAVERAVMEQVAPYPGPVRYPIEWQSERQRRAFFATDGFGSGIPYQRTGRLYAGWRTDLDRRQLTGYLTIRNTAPYAGYVYGSLVVTATYVQQRMHINTGWGRGLDDALIAIAEQTIALLSEGWLKVVDDRLE